jgi:hypothetical protein
MSEVIGDPLPRYRPWRRWVEIGSWAAFFLTNATFGAIVSRMDLQRAGVAHAAWEPWVWEFSSNLVLLALMPLVAWMGRRFPIHLDTWRRNLPWHLLASVVYSLLHVVAMVGLRMLAYASQGDSYEFGPWLREFGYEYMKDLRTYLLISLIIAFYHRLLLLLQGEARVLDRADSEADNDTDTDRAAQRPERFLVRKLGREFLINSAEIEWARAAGNYVNLNLHGREYPLRSTIGRLEEQLDPGRFLRVHRSVIVNLDRIASIEPLDTGEARLHLHGGAMLPCSRSYRSALRERLG